MAEAIYNGTFDETTLITESSVSVGEVRQLSTGEAAVFPGGKDGRTPGDAAKRNKFETAGKWVLPLTSSVTILAGGEVWWDHSANLANYKKVNDRDFYVGAAVEDSSGGLVIVDLNKRPRADIDLMRDGYLSVPLGTQAVGAFGYPKWLGGSLLFELTATNEAQKVDALSVDGFATGANAIIDLVFRVASDGAGTVVDASLGVANGTNATDADTITESIFVHLDANNTNINLESDDGSTEVTATDTTTDYTEGSAVANREYVTIDMRTPTDVQIYRNGVLMLPSTVFAVGAATGPWFLLIHLEKTSSTDTYQLVLDKATVRLMEQ